MTRMLTTFATIVTLLIGSAASAENWAHWRGPAFNGSSPETGLPTKFSKTENIKWTANLPGASASTPIIFGDRIFISSSEAGSHKLIAMCLDRKTGKELWRDEVGIGTPTDRRANKAAPSPVTDGKHVVFFYGTGDLAGYTVEGKRLWHRNLCEKYGDFSFMWTFSASPTMLDGIAYVPVLQNTRPYREPKFFAGKESFILAFEPATGKELWRTIRPSKAKAESLESFTTIIPHTHNGRTELILAGGDCLTGHDPKTGEELWRWGTWNPGRIGHWRLVPSAVAGGGVILACAPKGDPIYAVKAGAKGDISDQEPLWNSRNDRLVSSDVATPAFYMGKFFVLNGERRALTCIDPKTGEKVWQQERITRTIMRASPTAADGKIYTMDHSGEVIVFDAKTGEIVHRVAMGEPGADHVRPSIAVSQGNLFIKVLGKLYCVGE